MKAITVTLIILALVSTGYPQTGTTTDNKTAEKEVREMIEQYRAALLKRDTDALNRIWADDYTFINSKGAVVTKAQRLENIKSGLTKFDNIDAEGEINVRIYAGDIAVATDRVTIKGQYSGKATSGQFQSSHVWAKLASGWQLVSNQITPVAAP